MVPIALSSSMRGKFYWTWYWICPGCRRPIGGRARCRCAVGGQPLKDLGKFIHHHVPLFLEGLLDQDFDKIFCSLVFLSFRHVGSSRFARLILEGCNQIELELLIPWPHWGYEKKKIKRANSLWYHWSVFYARTQHNTHIAIDQRCSGNNASFY